MESYYKRVSFTCPIHHTQERIKYIDIGNGKTVLFLHGIGLKGITYKKSIILLAKHFRVIAPDLHSYLPRRRWSRIYNLTETAVVLDEFIRTRQLKNITLIGHSFGGGIALALASVNKAISKLILVNSTGVPTTYGMSRFYKFFLIKALKESVDLKNLPMFLTMCWHFFANTLLSAMRLPAIVFHTHKYLQLPGFEYSRVTVPTLILWGKKDEIFTTEAVENLHSKLKKSKLVLIEGNHDWLLFNPQLFYKYVVAFCSIHK